MGGGSGSRDVPAATTSTSGHAHSKEAKKVMTERDKVYPPLLMVSGRTITCIGDDAVAIDVDGTGSMGAQSYTFYDKSDRLVGQIPFQDYLKDTCVGLGVVGDAHLTEWGTEPDKAPVQLTEFVKGCEDVKKLMKQLWMEGGGGGQRRESYELAFYAYARKVIQTGKRKGWLIFLGDEGFYETISAKHLREHFGENEIKEDIPTAVIIEELKRKWNVLVLHIETHGLSWISTQWKAAFGDNFVDITQDPKSLVDFMLGFIALKTGSRDLEGYKQDMIGQEQTDKRIKFVLDKIKAAGWGPEPQEYEPNPSKVKTDAVQL